ncbi:hypothetical protein B0H11DRAFT_1251332 [Mycena galericulata]|nr:hypothetical protein B0H11DRAFT_1251332 [Mycena galericulata]
MPAITVLPANLTTLVLESCLYGILLILFISTIYFLATRRTLAGNHQTSRHHFTSLVFLGVTALFLVITVHWSIVIYQAFFAFVHLGSAIAEDTFYANLSQRSEILKTALVLTAVLLGDSLVMYRLWIIWSGNRYVLIFPICTLLGVLVTSFGILYEVSQWESRLRGAAFESESKPWTATGFVLSLITNMYSTAFIVVRISRATEKNAASGSHLMSFLAILVESAALQTVWFSFTAVTLFASSDAEYIASDCFPVIIGIANLLIQARVGLGWSQDTVIVKLKESGKYSPRQGNMV